MEELKKFINKKVFIKTKANRQYSGIVNSLTDQSLILNDKFNDLIFINLSEISSMEMEE